MKLTEQLQLREGKELYQIALRKGLPLPFTWSAQEKAEVERSFYAEVDNDLYFLRVLQDWEDGEYEPFDLDGPTDGSEEDEPDKYRRKWMKHCLSMGKRLREIEERKETLADSIAEMLLETDYIHQTLTLQKDPEMTILRSIFSGQITADPDGYYPLPYDPENRNIFELLCQRGYALPRDVDAYDTEDDRTHRTGLFLAAGRGIGSPRRS